MNLEAKQLEQDYQAAARPRLMLEEISLKKNLVDLNKEEDGGGGAKQCTENFNKLIFFFKVK